MNLPGNSVVSRSECCSVGLGCYACGISIVRISGQVRGSLPVVLHFFAVLVCWMVGICMRERVVFIVCLCPRKKREKRNVCAREKKTDA